MSIATRYARVLSNVEQTAKDAGRADGSVKLIAVSKTVGIDGVREAIEAGARDFGENRPDVLLPKAKQYPDVNWHFIGNIQSRRISDIVPHASMIHSLFQFSHAQKIDAVAEQCGKVQDVLVEVNVSGEESKSGLEPGEVADFICEVSKLEHVRVRGLMTMAPQGDAFVAKECFERLAALKNEVSSLLDEENRAVFDELSMGMSEDWPEAIPAGATMVRVGRAIFSDEFE